MTWFIGECVKHDIIHDRVANLTLCTENCVQRCAHDTHLSAVISPAPFDGMPQYQIEECVWEKSETMGISPMPHTG